MRSELMTDWSLHRGARADAEHDLSQAALEHDYDNVSGWNKIDSDGRRTASVEDFVGGVVFAVADCGGFSIHLTPEDGDTVMLSGTVEALTSLLICVRDGSGPWRHEINELAYTALWLLENAPEAS